MDYERFGLVPARAKGQGNRRETPPTGDDGRDSLTERFYRACCYAAQALSHPHRAGDPSSTERKRRMFGALNLGLSHDSAAVRIAAATAVCVLARSEVYQQFSDQPSPCPALKH